MSRLNQTNAKKKKKVNDHPTDWPGDGPIDLTVHDLPHESSTIEWWYQNCHLATIKGRHFSLFASFFRMAIGRNEETSEFTYAHSVTWALTDTDNNKYYADSIVDRVAPGEGLRMIEKGDETADKLLQDAIKEVFEKGNVPLPDRLMRTAATVHKDKLHLAVDDNSFQKIQEGKYQLKLHNPLNGVACELNFMPFVNPVRHGNNGVVVGAGGEDMFYYFIPACEVNGSITIPGESTHEVEGSGWYDHEFGKPKVATAELGIKHDIAWNWISLQLDNSWQISGYDLFDNNNNGQSAGRWAILIDPDGNQTNVNDFQFIANGAWTSSRTFTTYPVKWRLVIAEHDIDIDIHATQPDQEFITIISRPAFWEGRVQARGKFGTRTVNGLGYIERSGFNVVEKIEHFFKAVTRETRRALDLLLPLEPTDEQFARLVAAPHNRHFLQGLDKDQYVAHIIKPIREIVDRGGKSWRSYAALACIDAVGGYSQPYVDWLILPELLHTGSLIIDDVQDRSVTRRGGASCHLIYGEPTAINAGNACYFLVQLLLLDNRVSPAIKLTIYETYFDAMRAGHAGQAADISGVYDLMPAAVASGDSTQLESRIYSTHRLKSAAPPSMLAQIGALIGGGNQAQIENIGKFFEALGLAFQVIDDVLNLRGFKNDLKDKGEDITAGKITIPVAKAMGLLKKKDRAYLWGTIQTKPTDRTTIGKVINLLEKCGAIDACINDAEQLVETAWKHMDALVPDSFVKLRLRAFSWYVLQRHY
jgi:geranylgeranyl pyrophosphate synthase/predicted secreted hydrolase